MFKFRKYPSIINTYDEKVLNIPRQVLGLNVWYVTEKIHGANLQFCFDKNDNVKIGSRNMFTDETFFQMGSSPCWSDTVESVKSLVNFLRLSYNHCGFVIYGELFGGNVQKGVKYSTEKRVAFFDIKVCSEDEEIFLPVHEVYGYCKRFNLYCPPVFYTGRFEDCLKYPNDNLSYIPNELEEFREEDLSDNICEGNVIRPNFDGYFPNGSRIIFKNKNSKWAEKVKRKKSCSVSKVSLEELEILNNFQSYLTDSRVQSAISKIGREPRFIPELLEEVKQDILKDSGIETIPKKLMKTINRETVLKIKENL